MKRRPFIQSLIGFATIPFLPTIGSAPTSSNPPFATRGATYLSDGVAEFVVFEHARPWTESERHELVRDITRKYGIDA